ncbi:MAG: SUF system NifU family Fe-S cluster assembly protein [Dehalococcoidia bacterium]
MQLPDGLDDLYQEIILDHYKRPRKKGLLDDAHVKGEGFNPFCGDQIILTMQLDEAGSISNVGFEGQGCSISQASASMMSAYLEGKTLEEAEDVVRMFKGIMQGEEITGEQADELGEIAALQGVRQFPVRIKCALLGWTTLQDAITDYRKTHAE